MPWHINTFQVLEGMLTSEQDLFFWVLILSSIKRTERKETENIPNLGKVQGKSSMLLIQTFLEDNWLIDLKNLKMIHFL